MKGWWIVAGLAFGGVLFLWQGPSIAGQYFAGCLLEKALSVDNIFVFMLLSGSLAVPAALQRRVLYLGVLGVLVLRGGFIAASGALIDHPSWVFTAFGALVLLAGVRMFRPGAIDPGRNLTVRGCAGCCQLPATTPGELACPLIDRRTGGIRANPEPPFGAAVGSRPITTRAARIGHCVFALAGLPRSRPAAGSPRSGPPAAGRASESDCDASEAPSPAV